MAQEADDVPLPSELTLEQALVLAQELQIKGRYDVAEEVYRRILQAAPDDPNALHFMGVMRYMQGRLDEALALIRRSIDTLPGHAGSWINYGNVLLEALRPDEAVDAYRRASELAPNDELVFNNLGLLHARRNNLQLAEAAYRRALELAPDTNFILTNLASLKLRMGHYDEAIELGLKASRVAPTDPVARRTLCLGYGKVGKRDKALEVLRDWLTHEPDNPEAAHMLAAAGGAPVPPRASDAYVVREFDHFARSFDARLQSLEYKAPALCGDALRRVLGPAAATTPGVAGDVLDAGCGTGLCAAELRPLARRLEGVDLSQGMLDRAARRGYDQLDKAELQSFMAARPGRWDTIVSADTLCYFGALEAVCAAAAAALRPGGVLVFSVEAHAEAGEPGYRLQYHGRYAHHSAYLQQCLQAAGLVVLGMEAADLRIESLEPVRGWIVTARRPAA